MYIREKIKNCLSRRADMKVYHAHGFVIHSENYTTGDEIWDSDSSFSEVFFSFGEAKRYLINMFDKTLDRIYKNDRMFRHTPSEKLDFKSESQAWQREYLDEYICYNLVVSELEKGRKYDGKIDFEKPPKIDHELRCNGDVRTRYFVYGDRRFECRESDLSPSAGSKFKAGDIVICAEPELSGDYDGIYVVYECPVKPEDKSAPWVNEYKLAGLWNNRGLPMNDCVVTAELHEGDIALCDGETWEWCPYKEQLSALRKIITGEVKLAQELKERIMRGRVLFNVDLSWRDIPELYTKPNNK